jgi:bifunctional non-homologous end joining protein LigD
VKTERRTYARRRELLEALPLTGGLVRLSPAFTGDPADVLAAASENGLEGIVAKRLDSAYRPGERSRSWIKTPFERTTEVVIGGWRPGEGRRAGTVGSLLLGAHADAGRLVFIGQVGTGFTHQALDLLRDRFRTLARDGSPFDPPVPREHAKNAHWVDPVLIGEVAYRTLTPEGRLRHPSWRGLRSDRRPTEVNPPQ